MAKKNSPVISIEKLYSNIKQLLEEGKDNAFRAVNFAMVQTYWHIGKLIIEQEQSGKGRAEYGEEIIKQLSKRLTKSYGKGFNERNLWYIKKFYQAWPKVNALRSELSWTHYRLLLKVERKDARSFYMQETIACNWSTRTLERQLSSLYFERMLMTKGEGSKKLVKAEAEKKREVMSARDIIKDPYVLDFLELKSNTKFYEQELDKPSLISCKIFYWSLARGFRLSQGNSA